MNRAEVDVEVIPAEKRLGGGGAGGGWKVGMEPIELIEGEWVGLVDMVGRNIELHNGTRNIWRKFGQDADSWGQVETSQVIGQ